MICPEVVTVMGRPWTIEFVNETRMHGLSPADIDAPSGLTYGQSLKIFIGDWSHTLVQRENVLHELMHACVYGGVFDGELVADTDHEEWLISGIDSPLLSTLSENPLLVKYLTGH